MLMTQFCRPTRLLCSLGRVLQAARLLLSIWSATTGHADTRAAATTAATASWATTAADAATTTATTTATATVAGTAV